MDIKTAEQVLTQAIDSQTNNVEVLKLALSIINDSYQVDLSAMESAKKEADQNASDLSAEKLKTTELVAQVETLTSQNTDLQSKLTDTTSMVADLTQQVGDLKNKNGTLSTAIGSVSDAIATVSTTVSDAVAS